MDAESKVHIYKCNTIGPQEEWNTVVFGKYMKMEKIVLSEQNPTWQDRYHMFLSTCKAKIASQGRKVI